MPTVVGFYAFLDDDDNTPEFLFLMKNCEL
jgi:hypothetical protein